jgi:hypothetical protein
MKIERQRRREMLVMAAEYRQILQTDRRTASAEGRVLPADDLEGFL